MIIWGSTSRDKVGDRGTFNCPDCHVEQTYALHRVKSYFTLYFIPLFPTGTLGEYVRCDGCESDYSIEILSLSAEQIKELTSPWPCAACGNTNPPDRETCLGCEAPRPESSTG